MAGVPGIEGIAGLLGRSLPGLMAAGILLLLLVALLRWVQPRLKQADRDLRKRNRRAGRERDRAAAARHPVGPRLAGSACPRCGKGTLEVETLPDGGRRYRCTAGCGYLRGIGGRPPGRRP